MTPSRDCRPPYPFPHPRHCPHPRSLLLSPSASPLPVSSLAPSFLNPHPPLSLPSRVKEKEGARARVRASLRAWDECVRARACVRACLRCRCVCTPACECITGPRAGPEQPTECRNAASPTTSTHHIHHIYDICLYMTLYIYIDIYIDIYIYIVYMMYMLYAAYMFTIYADRRCPPQALSRDPTGVSQDPEPHATCSENGRGNSKGSVQNLSRTELEKFCSLADAQRTAARTRKGLALGRPDCGATADKGCRRSVTGPCHCSSCRRSITVHHICRLGRPNS